jgi:hypothetical protein
MMASTSFPSSALKPDSFLIKETRFFDRPLGLGSRIVILIAAVP